MQFYFVRHAQSVNNALWDETNSTDGRSHDPELSPTGLKQAELLAQFIATSHPDLSVNGRDAKNLSGFGITHIYCSLMLRSVQTASPVAKAIGLPLNAWIDIHEEGGIYRDEPDGEYTGLPGVTRAYMREHFPHVVLPDAMPEEGWWNRPFETREQRPERARRVLSELLERHGGMDDRVMIVSHGGFYNLLIHEILGLQVGMGFWFAMNNTGISRIDFEQDKVFVYANRTDWLPPEMIT